MNNKNINNDIDLLILKKIDGAISPDEEIVLNKYFIDHPEEEVKLEEYNMIWGKSSEIKLKQNRTIDQRWEKLETQITRNKQKNNYRKLLIQTISIAASLLVCIAIYFKTEKVITLSTEKGEIISSVLPDKSVVFLNNESDLEYRQSLFSNKRIVTLNGEAFFKVKKNRRAFVVSSDYAKIEVLGTEFNVKNRNSEINVLCQEGSVGVSNANGEYKVILKKGYATTFNKESQPIEPYQITSVEINGWISGIIVFNQTPILEVLDELERTFNITINKNNINPDITYNGEFDNIEVYEILEIITLSLDMKLSKLDDKNYVIK